MPQDKHPKQEIHTNVINFSSIVDTSGQSATQLVVSGLLSLSAHVWPLPRVASLLSPPALPSLLYQLLGRGKRMQPWASLDHPAHLSAECALHQHICLVWQPLRRKFSHCDHNFRSIKGSVTTEQASEPKLQNDSTCFTICRSLGEHTRQRSSALTPNHPWAALEDDKRRYRRKRALLITSSANWFYTAPWLYPKQHVRSKVELLSSVKSLEKWKQAGITCLLLPFLLMAAGALGLPSISTIFAFDNITSVQNGSLLRAPLHSTNALANRDSTA